MSLYIKGTSVFYNYCQFDLNEKKIAMVNEKRKLAMPFACLCRWNQDLLQVLLGQQPGPGGHQPVC